MAILINDTAPRVQYTATSGQTVFTVPFEFFVNSDLKVYRNSTLLTLTTNYTVTGAGVTGGGSVTFVTGATAGDIVTIVRDVPVARTSDFPTSGPFNIEALNTDLDRLTAMVQQQETLDGRSLRLDQFDTPNTLNVLPVKASRVGRVLQFNSSTGQPEAGPTTSEIANAQTYATNASNSATAAAASAATSSSAAASTAGSVAAAAASASAASTSASNASTSASNASTSAANAASSASTATTQATNSAASAALANDWATKTSGAVAGGEFSAKYHAQAAATSASNAASSASSASSAQTAAESARDATLAAYDNFDDRYLGAKASDPSLDNDGNALVAGALYFNSTDGIMKLYTGSAWVAAYVSGAGFLALSGGTMTGPVQFAVGSVSAPGITASGDTNTGIFFPAADTIAFSEGGAEVMRIDSSSNIGIGTVSPTAKLDVAGSIKATATTGQTLTIGGNSNRTYLEPSSGSVDILSSGGSNYRARFEDDLIRFYNNNNVVASIGALFSGTSSWSPNGITTRVAISDTSMQLHYDSIVLGKDLLNTVGGRGSNITWKTPTATTDAVFGNIGTRITGNKAWVFETGGDNNNGNPMEFYTQDASNNQTLRLSINGGVATSNFNILNSNVGIGTSSPTTKLDVNGNIAGGSLNVFGTGVPANGINNVTTNALGFFTNSTERVRIDSTGNLLVGLTSTSWNGSYIHSAGDITLAAGASITLSSNVCGSALLTVYVEGSGNGGLFYLNYSATAVKITGDGDATDTGSDFAVYKNANSHTATLKNRAGASQVFRVNVLAGRMF